ncbi:AEC family transporter [Peribacillus cavernae]|uniref:AEC family transporter n=1 Tax=Peribacillus cavernae TaxID=1674310 RepID=A0A3S0VQJ1_9BACI|nr:AEC family transporter [Peribacillus cavernae]MDQ0218187.1 putative permease [Peribacillus cavernae]RUQ32669.1 AEC family transporter [Peribacillus cavernae]
MGFLSVLLPIFGIFVLGFIGQRKFHFDTKGISTMALYLMSPVLVFRTFYTTVFETEYVYMIVYTFGLCIALIAVVYLISFIKKYSMSETCGMILASSFMNNGNYGTPVVFLLFGAVGLDYAIILMVIQQLLMCTVGVYYAAKGSPDGNGIKSALNAVKRMPIVYGGIAGFIFQQLHIPLNASILSAVDLVANAAIPTIMLTLGMQLATISIKQIEKSKVSISLILKLAISPMIAYIITLFLPVDDMVKQIMIVMAAMPTAANTTMYALQFNTEPDFVSSATFISTTLSLATLPIIFLIVL